MAVPTETEIRDVVEGYGISTTVLTDAWISSCRDEEIIPHIEDITGLKFDGEQEITEYYSGNGTSVLMLNRKPVNELVSISYITQYTEGSLLDTVELISAEGIIKARARFNEQLMAPLFRKGEKNIKVTYKYGTADYPIDVKRAIKNLTASRALTTIGARTGGGSVTVQSHGRNYGNAGKYTDIRKELTKMGYFLLRRYMTGVVGS